MGKRGRQKRVKPKMGYLDPIRGVDVKKQRVDLIIRKVDPSEMTPPKQHIFSPLRDVVGDEMAELIMKRHDET